MPASVDAKFIAVLNRTLLPSTGSTRTLGAFFTVMTGSECTSALQLGPGRGDEFFFLQRLRAL